MPLKPRFWITAFSTVSAAACFLFAAPAIAEATSILAADNHVSGEPVDEPIAQQTDEPMIDDVMNEPMDGPAADETMGDEMPVDEMTVDEMTTTEDTSASTIVEIASGSESFETLVQALQAANLVSTLSGPGPYTVFAPTDEAFAMLPTGALNFLLEPENEDLLTQVLTYHVVAGEVTSDQLSTGGIDALGGGLAVGVSDNGVVINNASVTQADIRASNGVIHQINRVLVPEALQRDLAERLGVSSLHQ